MSNSNNTKKSPKEYDYQAIYRYQRTQRDTCRSIDRTISGFPFEIKFAMHRLLKKAGIEVEDSIEPNFMGYSSITKYGKLTKDREVHTSISGRFSLLTNKYGIHQLEMSDNRTECLLTFYVDTGWDIDLFCKDLQAEMAAESLLKGTAFSIGSHGVEFFSPSTQRPIFTSSLEDAVNYSIYAPLKFHTETSSFRRGVLLSGVYGTGKSSVAAYTAHLATEQDITFIYLRDPSSFSQAITFFSALGKVVLFVEDIDRLFENDRDSTIDKMLNVLDGIDTKADEVMFIFTTNNIDCIERALLRPGRIDSIVDMELPNKQATLDILARYAPSGCTPGTLVSFVESLGETRYAPAVLKEITTRASLTARTEGRASVELADLTRAEVSIRRQVALINSVPVREEPVLDELLRSIVREECNNYED